MCVNAIKLQQTYSKPGEGLSTQVRKRGGLLFPCSAEPSLVACYPSSKHALVLRSDETKLYYTIQHPSI